MGTLSPSELLNRVGNEGLPSSSYDPFTNLKAGINYLVVSERLANRFNDVAEGMGVYFRAYENEVRSTFEYVKEKGIFNDGRKPERTDPRDFRNPPRRTYPGATDFRAGGRGSRKRS